ncbi:uncharacterized protein [Prorops nasuta]|uniref:uncharacterized protein n=1 Tax=Prorops nasuta TaxID=863751 RepID=UPI0034CDACDB
MASWYRRFIPELATVAEPLTKLTKKNQSWEWTANQQSAFDALKGCLTSAPTLACPDFSIPFAFQTDASNVGLGAVLTQVIEGQERVIAYASRALTDPERKTPEKFLDWKLDGELMYHQRRSDLADAELEDLDARKLVIPREYRQKVLKKCHKLPQAGHQDIMGSLTPSKQGFSYVLVIQDLYTKWIEVAPLRRTNGKKIAEAIENLVIHRWGTPKVLVTGNGTKFVNTDITALLQLPGMRQTTTPPYHPQWNQHLDAFRFAFNTAHHGLLQATPAFANLGREPESARSMRRELEGYTEIMQQPTEKWLARMKRLETLRTKKQLVEELHVPARRNFLRRRVIIRGFDDLWQADLVDMRNYADAGYHYILTVIDALSKYGWAIALKTKSGKEVTAALLKILKSGRCPKNLQTDDGKEFYNSDFQSLMKKHGINHYSTYSVLKATIVERWNRTLKTEMWKGFTLNGNYKWRAMLQQLVDKYNSRKHRTIGMRPADVKPEHANKLLATVFSNIKIVGRAKFKVGDFVRISKYKNVFAKGYTPNWTTEIFEIIKVQKTNPVTYLLRDSSGTDIYGGFYEHELLKTANPNVYLVEKVLRKKGDKVFVKWLGFNNTHNSWINKNYGIQWIGGEVM